LKHAWREHLACQTLEMAASAARSRLHSCARADMQADMCIWPHRRWYMCNYLHVARVHKTRLGCLVATHNASRWLRERACLCGAIQQRRQAVPQYRLALALPLQYFCAAVTRFWYWPDQPLVQFERRFVCGPSNCGSAVLQSCNSNCTTDQHSKRDDHVRLTIQEETPSDVVKFAANLVTHADVFSTVPVVGGVSESGEGRSGMPCTATFDPFAHPWTRTCRSEYHPLFLQQKQLIERPEKELPRSCSDFDLLALKETLR
jgi:hypothetical protein